MPTNTSNTSNTPVVLAYPTLDELFGNMDFCSCEYCKSVLSPAAYLVELMQFIDLAGIPHLKNNPIDELQTRRPDIQHIKLTCENTNISLPYIDIVNEIMEYFVTNSGDLTGFKELDIAEGTKSEDLIADPMFVNEASYTLTKSKVFPYNLPFDQPLEALRLIFNSWGATLVEGLEIFESVQSAQIERLGLNQKEYETLTQKSVHSLQEYFGEPSGTGTNLNSLNADSFHAKLLCRRLGITYDELVSLLKTNFINPANVLIPMLKDLDVNIEIIYGWYNGTIADSNFNPQPSGGFTLADYGISVKQWLTDHKAEISGLIMLKVIDPAKGDCDFSNLKLKYALPNTLNDSLDDIAYHKFHRFIRLWKKLGWSINTMDAVFTVFAAVPSRDLTTDSSANDIDPSFVILLKRISNFMKLSNRLNISEKRFPDWLRLWDASDTSDKKLLLAKYLRIAVSDIDSISILSGINPLSIDLELDEPSLLKFIVILERLKNASLKITDIDYLLRNIDITGKLTPTDELLLNNIRQIREVLGKIESENSVAPDNADLTIAKSKMALVYDKNTVDEFFGFLAGQNVYSTTINSTLEQLPASISANTSISYDVFTKLLTYQGTMSDSDLQNLFDAVDLLQIGDIIPAQASLPDFKNVLKAAIQELYFKSGQVNTFMSANPALGSLYTILRAELPENQPKVLVTTILPDLILRLKISAIKQLLTAMLSCDDSNLDVLLGNSQVLASSDSSHSSEDMSFDFLQLESEVEIINSTNDFILIPQITDNYILYIQAPTSTVVTLSSDDFTGNIISATIGISEEVSNSIELPMKAGSMINFQLIVSSLPSNSKVKLLWRTKGMAKQEIPTANIIRKDKADFAKTSFVKLYKSVKIQQLLKLTPAELTFFSSVYIDTKDILKNLITANTITGTTLNSIWAKYLNLVNFVNIRNKIEPEENAWLKIISDPSAANISFLISFNNWTASDLTSVLGKLSLLASNLSNLDNLSRVLVAMDFINKVGFPGSDVTTWVTNIPDAPLISTIKDAVKATSEPSVWRSTLQSINDLLRNKQRDALISYILQHVTALPVEIDTADKLYEYFLIDVQMDSCMKTSRIRMALSSMQLFVTRCLMNLEPNVSPSSIRAKQWEWMRRYRVWEANRKVFLYPENWLEPELRDNKSPFYRELEGELLQADITSELAETAYLNYLKKLDEVAKLEIAGMYLQENEQGNQFDDILHVFGRTNGTTRQYYYRRYEYGYWTAWEKVVMNIDGEYIYPIIWKSRLFLFWLNIHVKPGDVTKSKTFQELGNEAAGNNAKLNVEINMSWGEYYNKKWTSPKSSDFKNPIRFNDLESFEERKLWLFARKEKPNPKISERLIFNIVYTGSDMRQAVITYTNKNTPPTINLGAFDSELLSKVMWFSYMFYGQPIVDGGSELLQTGNMLCAQSLSEWNVNVGQQDLGSQQPLTEQVLKRKDSHIGDFRLLTARSPLENQWEAPMFYDDEHSVFFVNPSEKKTEILPYYVGYYGLDGQSLVGIQAGLSVADERSLTGMQTGNSMLTTAPEAVVNGNINYVIPGAQSFVFNNVEFGPSGRLSISQMEQSSTK